MANLNTQILSDVPFVVPSISTQNSIAQILGTLDDKIDLNRQINKTLEEMAQAIFKSWFVDFEPVKSKAEAKSAGLSLEAVERAAMAAIAGKPVSALDQLPTETLQSLAYKASLFPDSFEPSEVGEIPSGWKLSTLADVIKITGGGTPKKSIEGYWNGEIPWFSVKDAPNESDIFVLDTELKITERGLSESSTKLLPIGTTIISARGTVGRLAYVGKPMAMNQSCYGISGADGFPPIFNYWNLRRAVDILKRNAHGAVFDTITTTTFATVDQITPNSKLIMEFEKIVETLFEQLKANGKQSATLSELRDTLLPKLLSGELNVSDTLSQTVENMVF